jgi:hypothetical protein
MLTSEEFGTRTPSRKPRGHPFAKGNGKCKPGSKTKSTLQRITEKPRVYLPQRIADRSSFST